MENVQKPEKSKKVLSPERLEQLRLAREKAMEARRAIGSVSRKEKVIINTENEDRKACRDKLINELYEKVLSEQNKNKLVSKPQKEVVKQEEEVKAEVDIVNTKINKPTCTLPPINNNIISFGVVSSW